MKIFLPLMLFLLLHSSFKAQVLWTSDCDNASEWIFSNTSVPNLDWQITTSVNAAPLSVYQPLGFTTVTNGFLIIDSDAAGANATQNARVETATPIDLSANEHIKLSFENAAQSFTDKRSIEVSGDNGLTWTEYIVSSDTNRILYATENPSTFSIDISDVAGGHSQVLIAFIYEGINAHFWAIDDVQIFVKEANDLQLDQIYFGEYGAFGERLGYYSNPVYMSDSIYFSAIISNQGSNIQHNITAVLNINNGELMDTTVTSMLNPGEIDTLDFDSTWIHLSYYTDKFQIEIYSDSLEDLMLNNIDSVVTGNAAGFGESLSRTGNRFGSGIYNYGNEFETGLLFDPVLNSEVMTGGLAKIDCLTEDLPYCFMRLYELDTTNSEFNFVSESEEHLLYQNQINNCSYVYFWFYDFLQLDMNKKYLLTVGTYGNGGISNDLIVSSGGKAERNSAFFIDYDNGFINVDTLDIKPVVLMDFYIGSIDEESELKSISNFPNPVFSSTTIKFETSKIEEFILEVTDINGIQVHTQNLGIINPGKHLIEFDANTLPTGTYIYSIGNEKGKASKSMIVLK